MGFFSDAANLVGQALVFSFISLMIDPDVLPTYGGNEVSYLEFASIGIALGVFVQFALDRVAVAVRGEQLMGTLESVLMTPTSPVTIQLGSVSFDLLYIPIRTVIFLGGIALVFGLHFEASGILPAHPDPALLHPVRLGARGAERGRDPHVPPRRGPRRPGNDRARARLRRLLPDRPPAGLARAHRGAEPDRARDPGDARGAPRRRVAQSTACAPRQSCCRSRSYPWPWGCTRSGSPCGASCGAEAWGSTSHGVRREDSQWIRACRSGPFGRRVARALGARRPARRSCAAARRICALMVSTSWRRSGSARSAVPCPRSSRRTPGRPPC